jgi:hypothetical protein
MRRSDGVSNLPNTWRTPFGVVCDTRDGGVGFKQAYSDKFRWRASILHLSSNLVSSVVMFCWKRAKFLSPHKFFFGEPDY